MIQSMLEGFYRIVIPTTIFDEAAPMALVKEVRDEVKSRLAEAFGGYTETQSIGGWVAEDGQLIEEQVYVIEAYCDDENDGLILELAAMIKTKLQQEAVMINKNGMVTFL